MKLIEIFEADKQKTKKKIPASVPNNFVAKYAKTSGAGPHTSKKYSRKEKHKGKTPEA